MAAPSAVNKQPWHFVAVTDKDHIAEMHLAQAVRAEIAGMSIGGYEYTILFLSPDILRKSIFMSRPV